MPYPSLTLYPPFYPGPAIAPGPDASGNPTGFEESAWWDNIDTARPDALKWLAVNLLTGKIVCDLPGIVSNDATRRTIGRYESLNVQLIVNDKTSPSWLTGTDPFRAALIAYRGVPGSEVIYWGGIVLRRQRPFGGNVAALTLATPECYLDRRYTGPYTTGVTRRDQNVIVDNLVSQFCADSVGLPIDVVTVDDGNPVPTILAEYNDYDDKTVYSNIGALAGQLNGPEWTGHWNWDRVANTITPVIYTGNRIGFAVPDGLTARAVFDSANLLDGALDENYTSGKGANYVTATSSGQGLARPQAHSPSGTPNYNGRPKIEFRYSPSTSIKDPLTLQQHADHARALLVDGTNTVTVRKAAAAAPYYGIDWGIGDDIRWLATGPLFPVDLDGTGRVIGYESDDFYDQPALYVPPVT